MALHAWQIVLERIVAMPERDVAETFEVAAQTFAGRHRHFDAVLERNFGTVAERFNHLELLSEDISRDRQRLIGAYFTHEYSIEAAALGNPSMVAAPDQSGLGAGRGPLRHESSSDRRGSHVVDRVQVRRHRCRRGDRPRRPEPISRSRVRRAPHDRTTRTSFPTKLGELGTTERGRANGFSQGLRTVSRSAELEAVDPTGSTATASKVDLGRDHATAALVGVVELPSRRFPSRPTSPSGCCSPAGRRRATAWRTPASCASSTTTARSPTTRRTRRSTATRSCRSCWRPTDFTTFRVTTLSGRCRAQQGHRAVPAKDRRQVRGAGPTRQREQLRDDVDRCPGAGARPGDPGTGTTVGAHAAGKLRITARDRRRLARDHPRCRADAALHAGRASPRPRRAGSGRSATSASRCSAPTSTSARDTCPTSSTRAAA